MVSLQTRRDLAGRWRDEYAKADRAGKGKILDALCEATGWNRKYAMDAIRSLRALRVAIRRKRRKVYGPNEEAALVKLWRLSGFLASKRLAPFLDEFMEVLERHEELRLPVQVRQRLAGISAATIDRLLRRHRSHRGAGQSLTKPGTVLKKQIAVRTGKGWDQTKPGYCEVDTVAHCGEGPFDDAFFWTLTLTDIATGWTENAPLKNKGRAQTLLQLESILNRLPFDMLGLDSDNGGEFINHHLFEFCRQRSIEFTRSRPYHKNDQCFVEQKNASVVRRHSGYARYDRDEQFRLLGRLYGLLRLLVNFFEPSLKGGKNAMTPYRRLLASGALDADRQHELEQTYMTLNPVKLREELLKVKAELHGLESMVRFLDEASNPVGSGF